MTKYMIYLQIISQIICLILNKYFKECQWRAASVLSLLSRKRELEGTLSAILFIKASRYDYCFVSLTQFIYLTFEWVSLSTFPQHQSNLNLEIRGKLNFTEIFEIYQICTKHVKLERISHYVSLFKTFASNGSFIYNHH